MLLTNARYRALTGDLDSVEDDVARALADAQAEVEEWLRRPLESMSRTERVSVNAAGWAYPRATPLTSVPAGWEVVGNAVRIGATGIVYTFGQVATEVDLTYTGGYTSSNLPRTLEEAIAETARDVLRSPAGAVAGIKSASVGDASVTYQEATTRSVGLPSHVALKLVPWRRRRP